VNRPGLGKKRDTILSAHIMMKVLALVLAIAVPALATAQERPPDFRVQIWGDAAADFNFRVQAYRDLRAELERGLPPLRMTSDGKELLDREHALADRIRRARADARQGDIFTPSISQAFKERMQPRLNPDTCAALADDNPGTLKIRPNGKYPEHQPMSTMSADVLAVLPRLADDVEYRFLGGDLILVDLRSRLVVDRLPLAIACAARTHPPA
jgi:hypothetical protein